VFEPDNEALNPFAIYYKHGLHRFPIVPTPLDISRQEQFWSIVFQGGWHFNLCYRAIKAVYLRDIRRIEAEMESISGYMIPPNELIEFLDNPRSIKPLLGTWLLRITDRLLRHSNRNKRVIVKSVHCARQLDWINKLFKPEIIIIIRRLPNLIASYLRLRLNDSVRGIEASAPYASQVMQLEQKSSSVEEQLLHKMILQACELMRCLLDFKELTPEVRLIQHEDACMDPQAHFKELYHELALEWSQDTVQQIESANAPGSGFIPKRNAAKEQDRYSDVLTNNQLDLISAYAHIYKLTAHL
jgi:hypothetical protein